MLTELSTSITISLLFLSSLSSAFLGQDDSSTGLVLVERNEIDNPGIVLSKRAGLRVADLRRDSSSLRGNPSPPSHASHPNGSPRARAARDNEGVHGSERQSRSGAPGRRTSPEVTDTPTSRLNNAGTPQSEQRQQQRAHEASGSPQRGVPGLAQDSPGPQDSRVLTGESAVRHRHAGPRDVSHDNSAPGREAVRSFRSLQNPQAGVQSQLQRNPRLPVARELNFGGHQPQGVAALGAFALRPPLNHPGNPPQGTDTAGDQSHVPPLNSPARPQPAPPGPASASSVASSGSDPMDHGRSGQSHQKRSIDLEDSNDYPVLQIRAGKPAKGGGGSGGQGPSRPQGRKSPSTSPEKSPGVDAAARGASGPASGAARGTKRGREDDSHQGGRANPRGAARARQAHSGDSAGGSDIPTPNLPAERRKTPQRGPGRGAVASAKHPPLFKEGPQGPAGRSRLTRQNSMMLGGGLGGGFGGGSRGGAGGSTMVASPFAAPAFGASGASLKAKAGASGAAAGAGASGFGPGSGRARGSGGGGAGRSGHGSGLEDLPSPQPRQRQRQQPRRQQQQQQQQQQPPHQPQFQPLPPPPQPPAAAAVPPNERTPSPDRAPPQVPGAPRRAAPAGPWPASPPGLLAQIGHFGAPGGHQLPAAFGMQPAFQNLPAVGGGGGGGNNNAGRGRGAGAGAGGRGGGRGRGGGGRGNQGAGNDGGDSDSAASSTGSAY